MSRFTLAVLPDGRAILSTEERLGVAEAQQVREAVRGWSKGRWPVLIIPECRTVQVAEFDLDLRATELEASPAEVRHERLLEREGA